MIREIEIIAGLRAGRWGQSGDPFSGVHRGRPFITNRHVMLIGPALAALAGAAKGVADYALSEALGTKLSNDPEVRMWTTGDVPDDSVPCTACFATGHHFGCCLDGIVECMEPKCVSCGGGGSVYPRGIWSVELAGAIVDAFYLRVCLNFLQTDKPSLAKQKVRGPVVLSFLDRDAVLMPMKSHSKIVVELGEDVAF